MARSIDYLKDGSPDSFENVLGVSKEDIKKLQNRYDSIRAVTGENSCLAVTSGIMKQCPGDTNLMHQHETTSLVDVPVGLENFDNLPDDPKIDLESSPVKRLEIAAGKPLGM